MNRINQGNIDLELTIETLRRKRMEPIANLLQCLYDNAVGRTNHSILYQVVDGKERIAWKEERSVSGAAQPPTGAAHNDRFVPELINGRAKEIA